MTNEPLFGELISKTNKQITLSLSDDVPAYEFDRFRDGKRAVFELKMLDQRLISADQRKKIYAIIGDISNYTGYSIPQEAPSVMKWQYLEATGDDYFSLSNCSMSQANHYLEWLIDFCFKFDIPFKSRTWDLLPSDYGMVVRCCKHRKCIICGRHADIDHTIGTVGMGNDRRTFDNSNSYFLPLCRIHHTERHRIGVKQFLNKYHIKPVKLTLQTRRELGIGRN